MVKFIEYTRTMGICKLAVITRRFPPKYRKHRCELVDEPKKQSNIIFLHEGLAIKIIMDCRVDNGLTRNFKKKLGLNLHDLINAKQQTVIGSIKDAFEGENMQSEHYVVGYRIDFHFN